jgi:hypothetical protein
MDNEIESIMAHRDKIVAYFEDLTAGRGERAVLYDSPEAEIQ